MNDYEDQKNLAIDLMKKRIPKKDLLSVSEVASIFETSNRSIHDMIDRGDIVAIYSTDESGRKHHVRIPRTSVISYIASRIAQV